MKHYRYGSSTAARTIACPGWRQLADKVPSQPSSEFADRGTLLHDCMEKILLKDVTPEACLGTQYRGHTIDDTLLNEKLKPAYEGLKALLADLGILEYDCEVTLKLDEDIGGTPDFIGGGVGVALVNDHKFGDGIVVSPENNAQLMFQAALAMEDPQTADMFEGVERVVLAITQPTNHSDDVVKTWSTTVKELNEFWNTFLDAVEAADGVDPSYATGSHCKFCPAESICPATNGEAHQALLLAPDDLVTLTGALALLPQLKAWLAAVERTAFEQLEAGAQVDGWKMVNKHGRRQWADEEEALAKLARKLGGKGKVVDSKLKSPAQIEKLAKAQGKEIDLSNLAAMVSSGTTMVEESDKRPAVLSMKQVEESLKSIAG